VQSYIVRVYRRNPDNKNEVAGIIEEVETQRESPFQTLSELEDSLECLIKYDEVSMNG